MPAVLGKFPSGLPGALFDGPKYYGAEEIHDCAFTRGFLPDYPLSEMKDSHLTEEFFMMLIDTDYEGEMTDFFIWF